MHREYLPATSWKTESKKIAPQNVHMVQQPIGHVYA